MNTKKVTPTHAAKILGLDVSFVRQGLKDGRLPIGCAVCLGAGSRWTYDIRPEKLSRYVGHDVRPELRELGVEI